MMSNLATYTDLATCTYLANFVMAHTDRGECQCGLCCDKGDKPDPEGHTADMMFFVVCAKGEPQVEELRRLIEGHCGEFGAVNIFDGHEHGYMEVGGWLGSQEVALRFMGLGYLLTLFELMTPKTMLPAGTDPELLMQMAGSGMVTIRARKEKT